MAWPTLRANEQQSPRHSVDKHSLGPRVRVNRVGLSAVQPLPLFTQLRTYRTGQAFTTAEAKDLFASAGKIVGSYKPMGAS
jgi:hypothetical protein